MLCTIEVVLQTLGVIMSDAALKRLNQKIKEKRNKKYTQKDKPRHIKNELAVQRLSAEVVGKAQKYTRIGPREFVPLEKEDLTIDSIKFVCERHQN